MHRSRTGTRRDAQERTGAHRSARERHIMPKKGHHEHPINTQISMNLPFAAVVAAVLVLVLLLRILFE